MSLERAWRDHTRSEIGDADRTLQGKALTRPTLLVSDGTGLTYAIDVDIGNGAEPLRNVPIAPGNRDIIYGEAGSAVTLRATASGQYTVVGFAKEMPGTYTRTPIDVQTSALGASVDLTLSSRALTYDELINHGGYGAAAYGLIGVYRGTTLIRIAT